VRGRRGWTGSFVIPVVHPLGVVAFIDQVRHGLDQSSTSLGTYPGRRLLAGKLTESVEVGIAAEGVEEAA
jgi:hypothetical protein